MLHLLALCGRVNTISYLQKSGVDFFTGMTGGQINIFYGFFPTTLSSRPNGPSLIFPKAGFGVKIGAC
jgi:hypothetical protein